MIALPPQLASAAPRIRSSGAATWRLAVPEQQAPLVAVELGLGVASLNCLSVRLKTDGSLGRVIALSELRVP